MHIAQFYTFLVRSQNCEKRLLSSNNRCRYQPITQQYVKRYLIKNSNNYMYMFRPIAAIIRVSFKSMVVALIGLVRLYHDGEISTSVMFAIVKGHGGERGYL